MINGKLCRHFKCDNIYTVIHYAAALYVQLYRDCVSASSCVHSFHYRAIHFIAKRGLAIACRLSVCLSVTLVDCDHIGWNSSKIISRLVSVGRSLSADPNIRGLLQGNTPEIFWPKVTHPLLI